MKEDIKTNVASTMFIVFLVTTFAQVNGQPSEDQKDFILETHNKYRSEVSPPATNMLEMVCAYCYINAIW